NVLTEVRTASAAGARSRRLFQLRQRADATLVNRLNDRSLGDADTPADGRAVGHLGDVETGIGRWRRKEQVRAPLAEVGAASEPLHIAMAVRGVANENRADELVVANRELLVNAERAIFEAHGIGVLLAPVAGREHVNA